MEAALKRPQFPCGTELIHPHNSDGVALPTTSPFSPTDIVPHVRPGPQTLGKAAYEWADSASGSADHPPTPFP